MNHQHAQRSRSDITPAGVSAWCVWNGPLAGWKLGANAASLPPVNSSRSLRPVVRFVGADAGGEQVRIELRLDESDNDCWALWLFVVDPTGYETGYTEPLAWCRWPGGSAEAAARFLLELQREAFREKKAETDLTAETILQEFIAGTVDLVKSSDEDEGE